MFNLPAPAFAIYPSLRDSPDPIEPVYVARMALFLAADDSAMCTANNYMVEAGSIEAMKTRASLAVGVGVLTLVALAQEPAPTPTALHFGHLWDGTRLTNNVTVLVDDARIVAVGARVPVPKGQPTWTCDGYTAIPGLIDLHTHITYYWDRAPQTTPLKQGPRAADELFERAFENAQKTLETGVTTIRDLGASRDMDYRMRDAVNSGRRSGRDVRRGAGLGARAAARRTPSTVAAGRRARGSQSGSDWIKVYGSRGSYQSVDTTQTLTLDEMKAIVDAAHAAGKPVAIHSYGASGVRDAVLRRRGLCRTWHRDRRRHVRGDGAARHRWVPTIDHNRYYVERRTSTSLRRRRFRRCRTTSRKTSLRRARVQGRRQARDGVGCRYTFGQNTGELVWFVKAGMTPAQALATATTIPAATASSRERSRPHRPRLPRGHRRGRRRSAEGHPGRDQRCEWVMKDGKVVVDKR